MRQLKFCQIIYLFRVCKRAEELEFFSMSMVKKEFQSDSLATNDNVWTFFTVIRDPVERFLSAFVDKCFKCVHCFKIIN